MNERLSLCTKIGCGLGDIFGGDAKESGELTRILVGLRAVPATGSPKRPRP